MSFNFKDLHAENIEIENLNTENVSLANLHTEALKTISHGLRDDDLLDSLFNRADDEAKNVISSLGGRALIINLQPVKKRRRFCRLCC